MLIAPFITAALAVNAPACDTSRTSSRPALQEYRLDPSHSIAEFSIGFALSRVKGRLRIVNGTVLYDSVAPARSSITVVLDANSIETGWATRDRHLCTSDFFDVERYPTIEFRSTQLSRTPAGWVSNGELTMHGVTKRIAIPKARAATVADSVDVELEVEGFWADAISIRSPRIEGMLQQVATGGVQRSVALFDSLQKSLPPAEFENYLTGGDLLVRALIATCRIPEAERLSLALTRLFPTSHRAWLIHGFALAVSGKPGAADRGYAEAKKTFRPPVPDPDDPLVDDATWWYLDRLVRHALEWGYASAAVPLARAIAELYPQSARARTTHGLTLRAIGDARQAAAEFTRALEIDPRETGAIEWRRRL
jgi:polyisoprenoid-binding protein YceI